MEEGSYDDAFAGCSAVLHVGTPMGYGGVNNPVQVYEGAINGITNIVNSVKKAGTVKRLVYTSSFAAIYHPAPPGYVYTEADWASDNREADANWNTDNLLEKGDVGYSMAKVECEHTVNRLAEEDGRFDAISICPNVVLGPLLSPVHECVGSWQYHMGRTLAGKSNQRNWQALWNIVDVRDCGEVQVLIIESDACKNGTRYSMSAPDASGEITAKQLQEHLQALFPQIDVGGPPADYDAMIEKNGKPHDAPRAHLDKAREELGLKSGSTREIQMSQPVFDALKLQSKVTCDIDYVFANKAGNPLSVHNVTKRVWYPLLKCFGLPLRRPYQTRHTAATLWLAAGENPEWIARQMGHSTTEMLFRIYSRYVPNLTRQDGSAFESLLKRTLSE